MSTAAREDLLLDICGEIGDEDTSLVDRAEAKAERLEDLSHKRRDDADAAHAAVEAITEHIPLGSRFSSATTPNGTPGRTPKRIENGMSQAVEMWELAEYWKDRAAGAVRHAKYKELPAVRARRIKRLEADPRKQRKEESQGGGGAEVVDFRPYARTGPIHQWQQ